MKNLLVRTSLVFGGLLCAILVVEVITRFVMPISPGARLLNSTGGEERLYDEPGHIRPGLSLRQIAPEFSVSMHTTNNGYRLPEAGQNQHTLFIGDSFTFGTGLEDAETISALYCQDRQWGCANLGVPGSGTAIQVNTLERFLLNFAWRPAEVILLPMMMTSKLFAGNDLEDNLIYGREVLGSSVPAEANSASLRLTNINQWLIAHSNLARILKYRFGPALRSHSSVAFEKARLEEALHATQVQLERLRKLACKYQFSLRVLVLHPVQAIMNGLDRDTMKVLIERFPWANFEDSAELFRPDPARYYYSFDGHFNAQGSKVIAEYLRNNPPHFATLSCEGGE